MSSFFKSVYLELSLSPFPNFPHHPTAVAISLWISAVMSLLFISGWGIHCSGLLLLRLGTPPFEQLGNNLVTHHRK